MPVPHAMYPGPQASAQVAPSPQVSVGGWKALPCRRRSGLPSKSQGASRWRDKTVGAKANLARREIDSIIFVGDGSRRVWRGLSFDVWQNVDGDRF